MKQREIKFQILHKNIIVGEERLNEGSWEWTWFELNPDNFIRWTKGVITTGEGLIRRQFTGLLDKEGKEIYEGDICKCRYYKHAENDLYLTQKVVFDHASFFVIVGDLTPDLETETYTNCPLNWVNEIEIIGNIYQNPELL